MTKKKEKYICEICGNVVEVIEEGAGTLVCCGELMKLVKK
ncbi:MAG TPA: desulfoferrodoxin FeS4 iron-binding domain-containing protein [Candidatus Paceibacterota bacterium]|nr:desulfoferrodoxin FeS4 iron-binding domain-containing protein [Candidatus Paceibacterota bacterium]